jgi:phosphoglycerate dehydrogenase-like enzyme
LFTAPLDFDPAVMAEYEANFRVTWGFPYEFDSSKITTLVCDPSADYVIDDIILRGLYPSLRLLATPSTGTNHIDLEACKRRGVKVISLLDDREGLNTISASAEFTFKLLLDALRLPPARELQGKSVGLVGLGRIGKRLMRWCNSFGAEVYWYDPRYMATGDTDACSGNCIVGDTLEEVFECDAAIICCALTPETHGMITADLLRLLPHGAAVINTARGEIINEADLLTMMDERRDLRVAVDVVTGMVNGTARPEELTRRGAIVTPHIAGATYDSRTKAARIILNLLERELNHESL